MAIPTGARAPLTLSTFLVTSSWQNFNPSFQEIWRVDTVFLHVLITVNDSTGIQIRAIGAMDQLGTETVTIPFIDASVNPVVVSPLIYQIGSIDAGSYMPFSFEVDGGVPYIKFQIKALTPGGTPAAVNYAYITLDPKEN